MKTFDELVYYLENHAYIDDEVKDACLDALRKEKEYNRLERKMENVYGKCDNMLEIVVNGLIRFEKAPKGEKPDKSRLLTNEDVDKWENYKQAMEELEITKRELEDNKREIAILNKKIVLLESQIEEIHDVVRE